MVVVTLVCAIVGVPKSLFVVDIDTSRLVGHLKNAIKENQGPKITCVASDLQLYLAKKDGAWMTSGEAKQGVKEISGLQELDEEARLSLSGLSERDVQFHMTENSPTHVLVVLPQAAASGGLNPGIRLEKFWKAFRENYTDTDLVAGNLIALPEDTFILGQGICGSRMYVRHCYPQLWNVCLDALERPVIRNLVILGNPGIGKTFFGYFILLYLARRTETVVYEAARGEDRFLFCGGTAVAGSNTDFKDILGQSETFYVVDGFEPKVYEAKTILLTSPQPEVWRTFHKVHCERFYMPVWTEQEILHCRELMYPDRPLECVMECYRKWGGIARYVLCFTMVGSQQNLLGEAIDEVNLEAIVNSNGKMSANDVMISHRVLHFRVSDDFSNEGYRFASRHVLNMVYHNVFAKNRGRLLAFLSSCSKIGSFAVVYGSLFESYVHTILPRGGRFRVRRLIEGSKKRAAGREEGKSKKTRVITDEDIEEVVLRERKVTVFEGNARVTADDPPTYLLPASGNFESVDAMGTPNELYQITCAKVHPCKHQGLRRVLDMLGNPAEPRLYFVVPADIFEDFEFQNYQKSGRKKVIDSLDTDGNMKELKQYVMEIPLVEESKRIRPHEEACTCHQSKMAKLDIK
uniref:Crinkler effector protein N-terminal domain-containing protein n=1 Tax=Peronospora matthiolae TaxID=2874970 RepID=A0AAV1TTM9_9STRA